MSIVAISRGTFSGGPAEAEQVGERLRWPVLSREQVLLQAASDFDISENELDEFLNQPPS